ncbi:MAG: TetR/AcrR family transcriptional regulator [Acidimicrobiia bacterium]
MTTAGSTNDVGAAGPKTGRPRRPETDAAILRATCDLFAELGYDGMSVEAVAARAGVGKATIYRRWSSKDDLIIAAIQEVTTAIAVPTTGNLRNDLIGLIAGAIRFMKTAEAGVIFPRMAGEVAGRTPLGLRYVETVIGPRRAMLREVLAAAIESGELRSDLEVTLLADTLMGPIILRKILGELDQSPEDTPIRLVETLLDGWQ